MSDVIKNIKTVTAYSESVKVMVLKTYHHLQVRLFHSMILRSFQRKELCNSGLKAKSSTFAYNNK
mgnify:CR=1 FL=1